MRGPKPLYRRFPEINIEVGIKKSPGFEILKKGGKLLLNFFTNNDIND